MLEGLQMNLPLAVSCLIDHAAAYHADTEIVARTIEGDVHRTTYGAVGSRTKRLARALLRLGVAAGDRIGSLAWNTHRHFEMFYGVSGTGAVLHTINPRLFAEQLVYIINHAEDRILFIDAATLPVFEQIAPLLTTVRQCVMMAPRERMPAKSAAGDFLCYEELLAAEDDDYQWPEFDERAASTICYTSGTTGNPKGVVYSHRSAMLTTMLINSMVGLGSRNGAREVLMPMAPMFHGNAWQFPYVAPMVGAKLVLPGRNYEPQKLYELIEEEGVTITCGVPTLWIMLADWLDRTNQRFSKLRLTLSSGSAPPRALVEKLESNYGIEFVQAWGMTEALGGSNALMEPGSADLPFEERIDRRMNSGRTLWGVKYRIVDDEERVLPHDGKASGHLRVKGPWIASGYFKGEGGSALDRDGWLKTGDVASIDPRGHILLTDRSKDVIKSGGEWISSIALEGVAAGHPEVLQAAVIGVTHPKWQERPLLVVVRKQGSTLSGGALLDFMRDKVATWWLPDDVAFIDAMPMTGTGKVHKLTLRTQFRDYVLPDLERVGRASHG
ncbi:MAG TPA: long-chain fatty acid--CoA ligase [Stellaceae bacterium]|jgi:acyl-CoA synthetase (AMP-forming)/AMP-acid ligase II|nr:long-chain fatty acid--CoA ligase [Stellaceae bacterium]